MNVIDRIVECLNPNTKAELARVCDQWPQAITRWRKTGRVPAVHCQAIEKATAGQVTCHDLRPDVFPKISAAQKQQVA